MSTIVLLGPQTTAPTLAECLHGAGIHGPLGIVTAGWREREGELDVLESTLGNSSAIDLMLYHRIGDVFERDGALFAAHRERQNRLKELQRLYSIKLRHALEAARELSQAISDEEMRRIEWRAAIGYIRLLDRRHLRAINRIHMQFDDCWAPEKRASTRSQRQAIQRQLAGVQALLIAGGHVGVLLGRLRLLGVSDLLDRKPIFAWSAGAMVLAERLVLFHDHAPQGPNEAEVFELGLGLYKGVVALPDARSRLNLVDKQRVELMARRFSPAICAVLDPETAVHWDKGRLSRADAAFRLTRSGRVRALKVP